MRKPLALLEAVAGRKGGYLCTGGYPCCIFPAVKLHFPEAPELGAFIGFKPTLITTSSGNLWGVIHQSLGLLINISPFLPAKVHLCFMGHVSFPAPVLEVKPNITFWNETSK